MLRKFAILSVTMLAVAASVCAANTKEEPRENLVISGEVTSIEKAPSDNHYVNYTVHVKLHFFNKGMTPVIFFRPDIERETDIFWQGGQSLSLTDVEALRGNYIWDSEVWPSVDLRPRYTLAASALDKKAPPEDEMMILKPQEGWDWDTQCRLRFYERTGPGGSSHDLGWETIGQIKAPVWLRLSYMLWSYNLEHADQGLKGRLRGRWQKAGYLMTDRYLTTKPFPIKLYELEQSIPQAATSEKK